MYFFYQLFSFKLNKLTCPLEVILMAVPRGHSKGACGGVGGFFLLFPQARSPFLILVIKMEKKLNKLEIDVFSTKFD